MTKKVLSHFAGWCSKNNIAANNAKVEKDGSISFSVDFASVKKMKEKLDKEKYSVNAKKSKDGTYNVTLSKNTVKAERKLIIRKVIKEGIEWKPLFEEFSDNLNGKKGEYKQCERNALAVYIHLKSDGVDAKFVKGMLNLEFSNLPCSDEKFRKPHVVTVNPHFWIQYERDGKKVIIDTTPFMMPHASCPAGNADAFITKRDYIPDIILSDSQVESLINTYVKEKGKS